MNVSATRSHRFLSIAPEGAPQDIARTIAEERPVALEYNGLGYAVLMATPADLEDLAYGFSLTERLVEHAHQIIAVDSHDAGQGIVLRITLAGDCVDRVADRVRHRVSESSCGLCGIENLEQALRPLPVLSEPSRAGDAAIFRALAQLSGLQPLNAATGAVHAAAACDADGAILLVREDVGRHNAFDKLIGAMLRQDLSWAGGFALLSSRCSFELVEKAALSGCPMLVTISAPTALAIERAEAAGLSLVVLARPDRVLRAS